MTDLNGLLYQVTGIAMGLHVQLGAHHDEMVYHRMLLNRLRKKGYEVEDRPRIKLLNDDGEPVKTYIPDLRVRCEGVQALIELKADAKGFQAADFDQAYAYLSVSDEDEAVQLLNFGTFSLGHERVYQRSGRRPAASKPQLPEKARSR